MYLVSDLTGASPGIAAVLWAGLGAALVLIGLGLRRHWQESRLRPWSVLLAAGLIACGVVLAYVVSAWLGEAALVYGGADGRPAGPTPASVIGSWPLAQSAAQVGIVLGAVALLLMLSTTAVHRRRATRPRPRDLAQPAKTSAPEGSMRG